MSRLILIVLILLMVIYRILPNSAVSICRVIFLDVGQGDSSLIQCDGKKIVIDAGPDDSLLFKLGKYLMPWDKSIDLLILTHPHSDHIYGVADLIGKYSIKTVWINDVGYSDKIKSLLLAPLKTNVENVCEGGKLIGGNFEIRIISPECDKSTILVSLEKKNINNTSLVVEIHSRIQEDLKVLLMADAEKGLERYLVDNSDEISLYKMDTIILKAGHHCSNTSSSKIFVEKVLPKTVICSVGEKNMYGHPGKDTITLFESLKIKYYLTYQSGDVVVNLLDVKAF